MSGKPSAVNRDAGERGCVQDAASFKALLDRLAEDEKTAAIAYEALRQRLILFFRLHVPAQADELADITLDRLARKLHAGTTIDNVRLYALGIARKVVQEAQARQRRDQRMADDPTFAPLPEDAVDADDAAERQATLAAFGECLAEVGTVARTAILAYYGADGAQRISTRQRLATEAGVSLNALRNRAQRLRDTLERCVRTRLATSRRRP